MDEDILEEKDDQMESEETEQPSGEGGEKMTKINEKQEISKFDLNQKINDILKIYCDEEGANDEILQDYKEIFEKNGLFTLKRWSKLPVEDREKITMPIGDIPRPIANYLDEISGIKVKN